MRRAAFATYALALAVFTALIALPFLGEQRVVSAGVPSPPPLAFTATQRLPAEGRVCMTDLTLTPQAERMRFQVGTYGRKGPRLTVTVRSPGYRETAVVPAGFADNAVLTVSLRPPPTSRLVTLCIRNESTRFVALYSATDSARSRVNVFINGKRVDGTPWIETFEARPRTLLGDASLTAERIAVFRGFLGQPWLVWTLGALFVVGLPLLIGAGLVASKAERPRPGAPRTGPREPR